MTGVEPGTVMNEFERTSLIRTLYIYMQYRILTAGYCDPQSTKVVTHSHSVRETDIWHR